MRTIHLSDLEATRRFGEDLAARLQPGDLLTLSGPLGAGKTTLAAAIARGLGVPEEVLSPTFILIMEHMGRSPVLHLDAYRLESLCYDAIRDAGIFDLLDRDDAVKIREWPERIADFLPAPDYTVTLSVGATAGERVLTLEERARR